MQSKKRRIFIPLAAISLFLMFSTTGRAGLFDDSAGQKLGPGKEIHVQDAEVGGLRYYLVYLPTDYDAHRTFPIIFTFHSAKQEPRTWPFVAITGGKGFIVVGLEYAADAMPKGDAGAGGIDPWKQNVDIVRRIAARMRSDLNVDQKVMFIGGVGSGAIEAQAIAARSADMWAGVIILRAADARAVAPPKSLAGKPILIALPESDSQKAAAQEAADNYRKIGADVTFKALSSVKNELNTADPSLKDWLMTYGPVRVVRDAVAAGQASEKANRLGDAYIAYDSAARTDVQTNDAKIARESAQRLAGKANQSLANAERSISTKDFGAAAGVLIDLQSTYADSDFGRQAGERLKAISSEPAVVKVFAQIKLDGEADTFEAQALALERSQDFLRAMTMYDAYLTRYPTSHRIAAVQARLTALRSNKSIQAKQADTNCRSWLSLADNFIRSGDPDKARTQLHKILDAYGDTPWGEEARSRLKQLDSGM